MATLIRFSRSRDMPACSGAPVGRLAPKTSDRGSAKAMSVRMTANLPKLGTVHSNPDFDTPGNLIGALSAQSLSGCSPLPLPDMAFHPCEKSRDATRPAHDQCK